MSGSTTQYAQAMGLALEQARAAAHAGEIPIGAVVLDNNDDVIAATANRRERDLDPTAHAEVLALRHAAAHLGDWRLTGCTLVVTVEPCPMCAGAAVLARISTLVFGAWNEEYGASGSRWDLVRDRRLNHRIEVVSGLRADEGAALVRDFLAAQRAGVDPARS
ncbi:MAG TPA: nucleoside deaminase [Candidatus Nanopelagicales bacterium]|nr:nucleoside deaminase [Candidatus Nanopelagicales bacterium]